MLYEIKASPDRPGEAVITADGVELVTLPAPFGRQVLVQHASLSYSAHGPAADMLLHGIVTHRDVMASVQAREIAPASDVVPLPLRAKGDNVRPTKPGRPA